MSEYIILWTAPDATTLQLSGESYYTVLEDDAGWFMPGTNLILDYYQYHAVISRVRFEPRLLTLPVYVAATSQAQLDQAIDALCEKFNPIAETPGVLKVTRHDGTQRSIEAIYYSGLEGARSRELYKQLSIKFTITLKCPNQSWYDPTATTVEYSQGSPGNFFPIFPIQLAAGQVFGDSTVTNNGTMISWPIWTIDGPGLNPEIHNLTTGKITKFSLTLLTGESLIVDTRPGYKTVTVGSVNKFFTMSIDSSLWPLIVGNQTVKVVLSNTGVSSKVTLSYNERYVSL